jgi:hypothetical protein
MTVSETPQARFFGIAGFPERGHERALQKLPLLDSVSLKFADTGPLHGPRTV